MGRTDLATIAVVDIGKTNAKLTLTDAPSGRVLWSAERPTTPVRRGPVRDLGVEATWEWVQRALADAPDRRSIGAIVPVAHGAAAVFLDAQGGLVAAPDYEDPVFDDVADSYAPLRDPFAQTLSPWAPRGLNVGRQIHFLRERAPDAMRAVRHVVTHPQYWAFLLCGERASEVTSLGAHTDLWRPRACGFSGMAEREGWARLFPARRDAADILGVVRPALAKRLGLAPDCEVACGIHDSNASYLSHRAGREAPFTVVSSGTWTILMTNAGDLDALREDQDMLASVDAFGMPVGTARFMGGREYAAIVGPDASMPSAAGLAAVIEAGAMALPTFALAGPFKGRVGEILGADGLDGVGRASLASLYVALVTDVMLDLLGAGGDVIVDGPLAQNDAYISVLAAVRGEAVLASTARAGTLAGARRLVRGDREPSPTLRAVAPCALDGLAAYRARWRERVGYSP